MRHGVLSAGMSGGADATGADPRLDVAALVGSLRGASWNRRVMHHAASIAPERLHLDVVGVDGVPLFDEDLELDRPQPVLALDHRLRAADAVIVACPEYNLGLAGVAKNALDWLSRPLLEGPLMFKPCAVVCVSTSRSEPDRAAAQARTTLEACGATVMPEALVIRSITRRLDDQGDFTAAVTDPLRSFLADFERFVSGGTPAVG
jgi:chromate reductase